VPVKKAKHVDDGSMFDGAGGIAGAVDKASRIIGQIPAFRGINEDLATKNDALNRFKRTVIAQSKEGRELKAEVEAMEHLMPDDSDNPLTAVNKAIGMAEYFGNIRARRSATANDERAPKESRVKARNQVDAIDIMLDQLPEMSVMQKRAEHYKQNPEWGVEVPSKEEIGERAGNVTAPQPRGAPAKAGAVSAKGKKEALPDFAAFKTREQFEEAAEKARPSMSPQARKIWAAEAKRRGLIP